MNSNEWFEDEYDKWAIRGISHTEGYETCHLCVICEVNNWLFDSDRNRRLIMNAPKMYELLTEVANHYFPSEVKDKIVEILNRIDKEENNED